MESTDLTGSLNSPMVVEDKHQKGGFALKSFTESIDQCLMGVEALGTSRNSRICSDKPPISE